MKLLISLLAVVTMQATPARGQNSSPFFKNTVGASVLYDSKQDHLVRYNEWWWLDFRRRIYRMYYAVASLRGRSPSRNDR